MKRRGWNVVSAPIALVAIDRAQLTGTPSFTSAAARFRFSGVMRLIVPSSSSLPQRPQLLRLEIILTTSLSVRVVATGALLAGPHAGSGLEVLERHRLPLHPEPEVRHEDEIGMRAPRDERVALAAEEGRRLRVVELHLAHRRARVRPEPRAKRVVRLQREEAAVQAIGRGGREPVVEHSDYRLASDGGGSITDSPRRAAAARPAAPRNPEVRTASGHSTTALPTRRSAAASASSSSISRIAARASVRNRERNASSDFSAKRQRFRR